MELYIPLILGTAREGRNTEHAARFLFEEANKRPEIRTEFLDVRDFRLSATDNRKFTPLVKKYREIMGRADGLMIVTPEYNHGFPGELKMMLDMAFEEYARKPVAICGTGGGMGGARAVEQLRSVAVELSMVPLHEALYFPNIWTLFDESGLLKDRASYQERIAKMLNELIWYATALKRGREQTVS